MFLFRLISSLVKDNSDATPIFYVLIAEDLSDTVVEKSKATTPTSAGAAAEGRGQRSGLN